MIRMVAAWCCRRGAKEQDAVCPRCLRAALTREWIPVLSCRRCDYLRPVSWPLGIAGMLVIFILLLILVSAMEQLPEIVMDRIITCIIVIFIIELPFAVVIFMKERASCRKWRGEWQNLNVTELGMRLKDEDPAVRTWALEYLAGSAAEAAFPQVVEMLGDREAEVRRAAAEALAALVRLRFGEEKTAWLGCLAKIPAEQAPEPWRIRWLRGLGWMMPEWRRKVIATLAAMGRLSAFPSLLAMLDDEDQEARDFAADGLAWLVRVHCGEDRDEWSGLWAEG